MAHIDLVKAFKAGLKSAKVSKPTPLVPAETWQTQARGTNDQEYQVYVACAKDLGWQVKSYDEWLAS